MNAVNAGVLGMEPDEIEAMLPWHAAGTLNARDARRVEDALSRDPQLAKQFAVIREELGETIHLNESLGAPSARAMQKLFVAIDAEPERKPAPLGFAARTLDFFASLSPRTLAWSAVAGAVALLLQAGVIGTVLVKERGNAGFETASYRGSSAPARAAGPTALVQFAPDARVADITALLNGYNASITEAKGGTFRLQFGDKALPKAEVDALMTKLQNETIVRFVAAAQ